MKRSDLRSTRVLAGVVVGLALAATAVGLGNREEGGKAGAASGDLTVVATTAVQIQPSSEADLGTRFEPASDSAAKGSLAAEEALALFAKANPEFNPPDDIEASLGLYTASAGHGLYRFEDRLAWGYRWKRCPAKMVAPGPEFSPVDDQPSPEGATASCTFWLFLDAKTGEMLEAVDQLP